MERVQSDYRQEGGSGRQKRAEWREGDFSVLKVNKTRGCREPYLIFEHFLKKELFIYFREKGEKLKQTRR